MRILMATTRPYLPEFIGGAELSTHSMCRELQKAHIEVAVLSGLRGAGRVGMRNRLRRKIWPRRQFPADRIMGYPVYRGWDPIAGIGEVLAQFRPDVVVAQSGKVMALANAFLQEGIPICVYLRNADHENLGGKIRCDPMLIYVSNSAYTASTFKRDFGLESPVIPPIVLPDLYQTKTNRSRVVHINANPMKGVNLTLNLAERRSDIPFDIVESWTLPDWMVATAKKRAARLPNVRWLPARADMRSIYAQARVLIAPSGVGHPEWTETWGRVATEAHISGIPVLASNSGGLRESVGPGGILIDTDAPVQDWLEALSRLWDDESQYNNVSSAAFQYAQREEIQPNNVIDQFLQALDQELLTGCHI